MRTLDELEFDGDGMGFIWRSALDERKMPGIYSDGRRNAGGQVLGWGHP